MPDLAIFAATSGHSGVDRILRNLVPEFVASGISVDVLQVRDHGPDWNDMPVAVRRIDLGSHHVTTCLPALIRYLRRERPSVLFSDKDRVNRMALWARLLAGVDTRVAVRMGTTVSKNLERRGFWDRFSQRASLRLFYHWADCIITPSQGAADDLAQLAGLPVSRIGVLASPVVTASLMEQAEQSIEHPWLQPGQPPVILGIGELSSRKDFATLLRAFALVRQQRSCRLVIGGEGKKREDLLALARELGIEADIDLPGYLANPYAYMRRAQLFALTSNCEGMPVVLIEALACGTPVVSTDCPSGPRETLQDGRYGALVEVGDHAALAKALLETLNQPLTADILQQAAAPFTVRESALGYLRAMGLLRDS